MYKNNTNDYETCTLYIQCKVILIYIFYRILHLIAIKCIFLYWFDNKIKYHFIYKNFLFYAVFLKRMYFVCYFFLIYSNP